MIRDYLIKGAAEVGLALGEEAIQAFELYAAELCKWNRKVNLTAISSELDIAAKHIIDALLFADYVTEAENLLDVGSGAGIPAIPFKIVHPEVNVVSVDAVGKKINFQRHAARLLKLDNFSALHSRVENLHASHAGFFDVITSRAFSDLGKFAMLAAPLLKPGGRMIAMKGPAVEQEMSNEMLELQAAGFTICSRHHYELPFNCGKRCLVVIKPAEAA